MIFKQGSRTRLKYYIQRWYSRKTLELLIQILFKKLMFNKDYPRYTNQTSLESTTPKGITYLGQSPPQSITLKSLGKDP